MKKLIVMWVAGVMLAACTPKNPEGEKAQTTESAAVAAADGTPVALNLGASKVIWTGSKVSGSHTGTVTLKEGTLYIKEGKVTGGNFVADLNTINDTDMQGEYKGKLEGHLKAPDFFDVANFPEATFEITNVAEGAEAGKVTISGNLTMRGVTKNVTFSATVTEATENSVKATADFNVLREDWGLVYTGMADDLISKEFNLKIELVAGVGA
ncbi:MAG: YceI family protein [Cyclobacteriaceae bacterium]|nr:YceI family protein [Cyclobacteriaceae bacterium]